MDLAFAQTYSLAAGVLKANRLKVVASVDRKFEAIKLADVAG